MTVLQRAATIAVMTFSLAGLIGTSSPSKASDLDRTAITAPSAVASIVPAAILPDNNTLTPAVVPQPDASVTPQDAVVEPAVAESDDFHTLADAVAAQQADDADDAVRCLAGAVYFESKGEPLAGQLAVANVIINRSKSGRFPKDVCSVVTQRGQFSFVRGGQIPSIDAQRASYRTAIAVAKVALAAAWDSPAPKALYFNTPNRRPGGSVVKIAAIGNHVFYR